VFSSSNQSVGLLSFWAKLGSATYPDSFHPLLFHLLDVAAVASRLWNEVLRPPVKTRFATAIGLSQDDCAPWVAFWVGAHDIGKASPAFQSQGKSAPLTDALRPAGFDFLHTENVPHGTVSVPVLYQWLMGCKLPIAAARRIAQAVGGHHGVFPEVTCFTLGTRDLGNKFWNAGRMAILDRLANLLGVPRDRPPQAGDGDDQSYLMVLAGLTTVADWVGSNQEFFRPAGNAQNWSDESEQRVLDYFTLAQAKATEAVQQLGWLRSEAAVQQPLFLDLFRFLQLPGMRPLQQAASAMAPTLDRPTLVLVEAPMGEGKTEAALYLADAWERRGGQGMYVALPTMATSNGMFTRFVQFLREAYPDRLNLHLLHGHALLSPAYEKLCALGREQPFDLEIYDTDNAPGVVLADSWFAQDRKHGMLAPFAVGTIDQALLAVLQTRHGFVRLFGLAGKVVVLDEVHAYDVYMTTLLQHLLRWLSALGCPVILLSATLPRRKRLELLDAYTGTKADLAATDQPYPRISRVCPGENRAEVIHIPASEATRKTLHFEWIDDDMERIAAKLTEALQAGGCAAVIRNTVGTAQETYRTLKQLLPGTFEVELFHARFPFGRRQEIETRVVQRYGKEGPRPAKAVLVATQVVEQSLDLDFDLLVTDLAPVDLVLQRAGRLWRHDRPRPAPIARPTVWLLEPKDAEDGVPHFGAGQVIYERFVLLRSYLVLQRAAVQLPDEIEGLIESVYGEVALPLPETGAWATALADALQTMEAERKADSKAGRTFLVATPTYEDNILNKFNQQLEEDNPDVPKDRQACTRLAEPSIALVILYEIGCTLYLDPAGKQGVSIAKRPMLEDAKKFLNNAVTIQNQGCYWHYVKQAPPPAWQKSGLMRFHRVVRVDGAGKALPGEYPLLVDQSLGIEFPKPKEA